MQLGRGPDDDRRPKAYDAHANDDDDDGGSGGDGSRLDDYVDFLGQCHISVKLTREQDVQSQMCQMVLEEITDNAVIKYSNGKMKKEEEKRFRCVWKTCKNKHFN